MTIITGQSTGSPIDWNGLQVRSWRRDESILVRDLDQSSYVLIVFSLRYFYRLKYSNVGTFHLILPSRSSMQVVSSLPDLTCCFELALSSLDIFSTPGTSSNLISRPGLLDTADCLPSTHPEPFPEISLFFSGD